jgi:hypothetical protein
MQISRKDFFVDNVRDGNYCGTVVDIEDPLKIGRVRVEVFGFFDGLDPTLIPWATPATSSTGGSDTGGGFFSVPKIGSVVEVKFDNGNIYNPQYSFNQRISDELKEEISASYTNAHSLIYDTEAQPGPIKLFFTEEKGLMLDYNGSQVNIRPDNTVYIEHSGGKIIHIQGDHISIGKETESDEPAVLGEKNVDALNALADEINNLSKSITKFATSQVAITSAVFPLSPLGPALSTLLSDQVPIQAAIASPIKATTIPKTRSSTVSLDGPSM